MVREVRTDRVPDPQGPGVAATLREIVPRLAGALPCAVPPPGTPPRSPTVDRVALILVTGSPGWTDTALIAQQLGTVAVDLAARDGRGIALMHAAAPRRRVGHSWASADWHAAQVARVRGWLVLDRPLPGCPPGVAGRRLVAECVDYRDRWGSALVCVAFPLPCNVWCGRVEPHWEHTVSACAGASSAAGVEVRWVLPDGGVEVVPGRT